MMDGEDVREDASWRDVDMSLIECSRTNKHPKLANPRCRFPLRPAATSRPRANLRHSVIDQRSATRRFSDSISNSLKAHQPEKLLTYWP